MDAVRTEIVALHDFFAGWFSGSVAADEAASQRLVRVLAEDFVLVDPEGRRTSRAELMAGLLAAHGTRSLRIWVDEIDVRPLADDLWLATYREWQQDGGPPRGRLSSAIFRRHEDNPEGVQWLHVHETWLP